VDLRHFRYFVAVAEELSFSRAAQRLHISQPPLSMSIQELERNLGVVLLKRNRRRVELTNAGQLFLEKARATLAHAAQAIETARRAGRGEVGTLRIGFTATVPFSRIFPRALRAYRLALPEAQLELRLTTSEPILESLTAGDLDVGLIRPSASLVMPAGITAIPILNDRLMLALHASHPLAEPEREIPIESLADEGFILRTRGSRVSYYEQVYQLCERAGFTPRVSQEAHDATTILGLVAAGLGLTILPASLRAIHIDDVVWRELLVKTAANSTMLLVFSNKEESTAQRSRFIELVQRFAVELTG
jgi:DNA-binding transcriptional LysR family regulator